MKIQFLEPSLVKKSEFDIRIKCPHVTLEPGWLADVFNMAPGVHIEVCSACKAAIEVKVLWEVVVKGISKRK